MLLGAVIHERFSLLILSAKTWEDRPIVIQQIDQIGVELWVAF